MKAIFMGTPDFAVPALRALCDAHEVVAVYTKADKPAGRGRKLSVSPAKEEALARGLLVKEPKSLRRPEAVAEMQALQPDFIVVAAYGLILPQAVLDIPPHGCINIHGSLLPRYRGASPIAGALLAGEQETGITLMLMDAGLDTGPMLAQRSIPIEAGDNTGTLETRLSLLGAELLAETLPRWLDGRIVPQMQDDSLATLTRLIKKEDGLIDWSEPATNIVRKVKAFAPWPGAFTIWQGQPLKLLGARSNSRESAPGLVSQSAGAVLIGTGAGSVEATEVQAAGKRAMSGIEFVRGHSDFIGARLAPQTGERL